VSALTDRLVAGGYEAGWSAVRHMPERAAYAMFRGIADEQWLRRGKSVRRLESNLRRVLGPDISERELREVSRAGVRSYLRYYCDAFRLPGWSNERIVSRFRADDQHLTDALALGNGVVATLPHMGNWDHAGAWANLAHQQVTSVAERLKPEEVYEKFLDYRRAIGIEILPLTGGEVPVFEALADRLRGGGLVALLGDRDLTSRGVEVEFFGATTKLPAGPAALALQTGATLVPASLWYDGPYAHVRIYPPVPVPETGSQLEKVAAMTQQVARCFEDGVRAHPEDWHMMQRLWLDDLDPARSGREA
jgi:KDO2-lipid IV(A) lauroyltransferase